VDCCSGANANEAEFERLTAQIAELEIREAEILAIPGGELSIELAGIREERAGLTRELEELWARRSNRC
jgi:hypothetical protein